MRKKARFILGGVMLLFMVGFYVAFFISIDAGVSDLIPFWPMFLSLAVAIAAIFIGFWYMPKQHRTPAIAALAMAGLFLRELTIHMLSYWYVPMAATAVVIIICVAVFLPVKNDTTTD
jgi:anti-sigma-K factor RskA